MAYKPPYQFTVIALVIGLLLTVGMVTFMPNAEVALAANAEPPAAKRPDRGEWLADPVTVSLDKAEIGDDGSLIRDFRYSKEPSSRLFGPGELDGKHLAMAALIAPYAPQEIGAEPFETTIQTLLDRIDERAKKVVTFFDEQKRK